MAQPSIQSPKVQETIQVSRKALPLCCPRPQDTLWDMHPRVYLAIEKTGQVVCPYCGAKYELKD